MDVSMRAHARERREIGLLEKITGYLSSTTFFREHVANWEPPLNDPYFDVTFLFFALFVLIVPEICDLIRMLVRRRLKMRERSAPIITSDFTGAPTEEVLNTESDEGRDDSAVEIMQGVSDDELSESPSDDQTVVETLTCDLTDEDDVKEVEEVQESDIASYLAFHDERKDDGADIEEDEFTRTIRDIMRMQEGHAVDEEKAREKERRYKENAKQSEKELNELFRSSLGGGSDWENKERA